MLGGKNLQQPGQDGEAPEDEQLKVQNIPRSQREYAQRLVPYFGEQTPCLMYSAKWKQRETGVQQFTTDMPKSYTMVTEIAKQDNIPAEESAKSINPQTLLSPDQRWNLAIL